ncbi:MAG TPA: glycosyltransferase [Devosiaceae bacterium]|nr:glycosyltransferase [Devosiaceae bacterium]
MNSIAGLVAAEPVPVDAQPGAAVVITTYNHARYLAEAIESVLAQSRPAAEIIVVDDGSTDDSEAVVRRYPDVRFIRQDNQGLSAARNTGLVAAASPFIAFLDADDLLLPRAIERGLAIHAGSPGAAFVYGGHRRMDGKGVQLGPDRFDPIGGAPFLDLLRGNPVAMHGAVLFNRRILLAAGGYDATLKWCEDYDVYLRLARTHPVVSYPDPVAIYRFHGANMSNQRERMLGGTLFVLERHAEGLAGPEALAAREGRSIWIDYYAETALADAVESLGRGRFSPATRGLLLALKLSPRAVVRNGAAHLRVRLGRALPEPLKARLRHRRAVTTPLGKWRGGDFARGVPASRDFGWDRGEPIDRYYIEGFLERWRSDIAGHALEVGDDAYCRRFGGERVTRQDVLHIHHGSPQATIVGDLADPATLPANAFDCLVLTQTLHLVFDLQTAVRNLHASLRPGGVALVTVPGISQIDRGEWGGGWCWSFTAVSAQRLFVDVFGPEGVIVESNGNFFAATSFLAGLAQGEVDTGKLDPVDPAYPVIVTIRARKHG